MEQVEIRCRCENCKHFEPKTGVYGYCYYWDYEQGERPNEVNLCDFCSNGEPNNIIL